MTAKQVKGSTAPDGSHYSTLTDGAGNLAEITLSAGDIEIGAVELKNGTTDQRATINASGELLVKETSLEALVGEVQASPTTNTVLERLKVINTSLTTLNTSVNTNPVGTTPTDRTIASMSGSSQQLMAANSSRRQLIVQNTGSSNIGINPTGGTASIGAAGTLTLVPGGSYYPRIPTLSAVTVIGTASQPVYAEES